MITPTRIRDGNGETIPGLITTMPNENGAEGPVLAKSVRRAY